MLFFIKFVALCIFTCKSVYLRQNFSGMKLIPGFLILGCILSGCKNKELPSEYLSTISVVRQAEATTKNNAPTTPASNTGEIKTTPVPAPKSSVRYHIIVSSFGATEKARAERLVSQLKAKNYPATLIYSSKRYRVSIESFTSEAEANAARDEYRETTDRQDIWVHKVE